MFYISSWMLFRDTGEFLDRHSIRMWLVNPVEMLEHLIHLRPVAMLVGPLAALAIAITITWVLPRWSWLCRNLAIPRAISVLRFVVIVATFGTVWGEFVPAQSYATSLDSDTGIRFTAGELYRFHRDNRMGPLVHLVADVRATVWAGESSEQAWLKQFDEQQDAKPIRFTHRPQVSMDDFLAAVDKDKMKRHNVILLILESLRLDQLRTFGGSRDVMPNVDAVARESLRFTNAYTLASHSNYADLCPLSSHYPLREAKMHIYPRDPTYPRVLIYDILKPLGYRTAIFSSQNERWGAMLNYLDTGNLDTIMHSDNYEGPTYTDPLDIGFWRWANRGRRSGKLDDRITIKEAIRWIGEQSNQPFFMYINLQNSHFPYVTPSDFPRRFGPKEVDFPYSYNNYPPEKAHIVKDIYSDSLHYVDAQVGRLVDHLKQSGQWENTTLIITGDTGQAFMEHGFACHGNKLYNEVMRVPLIIRSPGCKPKSDARLASHLDVPPTVLQLLGLPLHPSFQGESLLAADVSKDRDLFLVVQAPLADQTAIVKSGFKLIADFRLGRFHLYDLVNDPNERRDVVGEHPDMTRQLANRMLQWRKAQINYYADKSLHQAVYPPMIVE